MEAQGELICQDACGSAHAFVHEQHLNKHCAHALSDYTDILRATERQNWQKDESRPQMGSVTEPAEGRTVTSISPPTGQCNTTPIQPMHLNKTAKPYTRI